MMHQTRARTVETQICPRRTRRKSCTVEYRGGVWSLTRGFSLTVDLRRLSLYLLLFR